MPDKKDAGTALVPTRIEPLDKRIVPVIGYRQLELVDREKKDALDDFMKSGAKAGAGLGALAIGLILSVSLPISAPASAMLIFLSTIMMGVGLVSAVQGSLASSFHFMRILRANRMGGLPRGTEEHLARMEGTAYALIDAWNVRAESWNEGWEVLEREEKDLFALQDRCTTKKSLRGLIRRIESVRKEKRKHLKVRAKLEVERDRILAGIEAIRKHLPLTKNPLYLTDDEE